MNRTAQKLFHAAVEFSILTIWAIAAPTALFIDTIVIGHGVPECSVTEIADAVLALGSALLFWYAAWRQRDGRGFFLLAAGFFACMFIRELDALFDLIHHGFWVYPALVVGIGSIVFALRYHRTLLDTMAAYTETKSCTYVVFGLVMVIAFSRFFGSGQLLWQVVMGPDYNAVYKSMIQEGLELFGYGIAFYGSCLVLLPWPAAADSEPQRQKPRIESGKPARWSRTDLLVAQRFDRIETRRLPSRIEAEQDAHCD